MFTYEPTHTCPVGYPIYPYNCHTFMSMHWLSFTFFLIHRHRNIHALLIYSHTHPLFYLFFFYFISILFTHTSHIPHIHGISIEHITYRFYFHYVFMQTHNMSWTHVPSYHYRIYPCKIHKLMIMHNAQFERETWTIHFHMLRKPLL